MTTTAGDRRTAAGRTAAEPATRRWRPDLLAAVVAVTVVAGVVVRFLAPPDLWLDEALTVSIARLPVPDLLDALRHDGAPPLYYLLLHGWMRVVGSSPTAVRALSGLASVAALPVLWQLGRRSGGRAGGAAALVLLASAPFALRYASEARMYSLVLLEVCLGGLALVRAHERPTVRRLAGVTAATLALALTHYWTLFLLLVVGVGLLATRRWRLLGAMAAAGVLFLPQVPTLAFQAAHTGTPWAASPQPKAVVETLLAWGGPGGHVAAVPLAVALLGLAALAAGTISQGGRQVVEWRGDPRGRVLLALSVGPLAVAVAVAMATHSGYVVRYTAVALPAYLLLVALGVTRLPRRVLAPVLAVLALGGVASGASEAAASRTQAHQVAAALNGATGAGDLVVYCPDQLAPAVHRLLGPGRLETSYGDDLGPDRVDWVDYRQRNAALDPVALADGYSARAGSHAVALVAADGYRTLEGQCPAVAAELARLRPAYAAVVRADPGQGEDAGVTVFRAPGPDGAAAAPVAADLGRALVPKG